MLLISGIYVCDFQIVLFLLCYSLYELIIITSIVLQQSINGQSSKQTLFSSATQLISIQPLEEKPCTHSLTSALKDVECTNNIIGHGGVHLLTPTFFENLELEFQSLMKVDYSTYPRFYMTSRIYFSSILFLTFSIKDNLRI